jgi:hypothetical protein
VSIDFIHTQQSGAPAGTPPGGALAIDPATGLIYSRTTGGAWVSAAPVSNFLTLAAPVSTTAAALENMAGFTFNLTLPTDGRIYAAMAVEANTTGGGSNATGAWAIAINSVDIGEIGRFLSGTNDLGALACVARSAVLTAGTYAIQGRFYRRAGDKTVTAQAAHLFAQMVS